MKLCTFCSRQIPPSPTHAANRKFCGPACRNAQARKVERERLRQPTAEVNFEELWVTLLLDEVPEVIFTTKLAFTVPDGITVLPTSKLNEFRATRSSLGE